MIEPGRDAERRALEKRLAWEELAVETHKLIGGVLRISAVLRLLSSFDKLFSLLLSVDSASRRSLAGVYEERFSRPLGPAIEKAFSPSEAQILSALLSDRVGQALSLQLDSILERGQAERAERLFLALEKLIAGLPRAERRRIDAEFAADEGRDSKLWRVKRIFSPELAAFAGAVLRGSRAEADARFIHVMLRWEPVEACRRLIKRTPNERAQIDAAYRGSFDIGLEADMRTRLEGSLEALAVDLLGADERLVRLSRVRAAIERTSDEWVGESIRQMDASERRDCASRYNARYPGSDFFRDLRRRHTARDYEILCDLIEHGMVPRAKLLWFAVAGPGTDEAALTALLEDTGGTLPELKQKFHEIWLQRAPRYERPFPHLMGDLRRRLWLECAGDSWCDLQEVLDSSPGGVQPLAKRLNRIHAHERSGYLLKRLDFFSSEGRVMDRDVRLASDFAAALALSEPTPSDLLRLEFLVRLAELDCAVFRSLKHTVGNAASTAFAGAGGFVAALSISLLSKDILHVMLGVGVVSLGIRFALKKLLKGRGYHRDEVVLDLAFAAVDGVTLYLGRVFQKALIGGSTRFASRFGLKKSLDRISREIHGVSAEIDAEDLPALTDSSPFLSSDPVHLKASLMGVEAIVATLSRVPAASSARG